MNVGAPVIFQNGEAENTVDRSARFGLNRHRHERIGRGHEANASIAGATSLGGSYSIARRPPRPRQIINNNSDHLSIWLHDGIHKCSGSVGSRARLRTSGQGARNPKLNHGPRLRCLLEGTYAE